MSWPLCMTAMTVFKIQDVCVNDKDPEQVNNYFFFNGLTISTSIRLISRHTHKTINNVQVLCRLAEDEALNILMLHPL